MAVPRWHAHPHPPTHRSPPRLEEAIDSDKLRVHYQPIVELASGHAVGFEALIRLDDADQPMSPRELIMAAEDIGLITTIGDWVLGRALADAVKLNPPGTARPRYVSVNVSARQLRQPDFVDTVRAHVRATGADPSLLVLEITENLLVDDDDRAWAFLARPAPRRDTRRDRRLRHRLCLTELSAPTRYRHRQD